MFACKHNPPRQPVSIPARCSNKHPLMPLKHISWSAGSKRLPAEPSLSLSCEVAIRPSFCWNSHVDTWQAGGVWSQFDSGLKSCQDDVVACTNFLGHQDAAFAGMHHVTSQACEPHIVHDLHSVTGRAAVHHPMPQQSCRYKCMCLCALACCSCSCSCSRGMHCVALPFACASIRAF